MDYGNITVLSNMSHKDEELKQLSKEFIPGTGSCPRDNYENVPLCNATENDTTLKKEGARRRSD